MSSWIKRRVAGWVEESITARYPYFDGSVSDKNDPPSNVSELVSQDIKNRDLPEHQRKLALLSPVGYAIVVKIAQNTFDDGFEFVDEHGNVIMQDMSRKLRSLNVLYYLTQGFIMERMYGRSFMFVGKEKLQEDVVSTQPRRVTNLDVFGPETCKVASYDKNGQVASIEIKVVKGTKDGKKEIDTKTIYARDLIPIMTRPRPFDRSGRGLPMLYSVWNTVISLERACHASDFYLGKIGHGMYVVKTKGGMSDTKMNELSTTMEDASVSRIAILDGRNIEDIGFINASGSPINFPEEIDSRLGLIAAGTGVPKDIIIGLSAGTISGSETNIKVLYQTINLTQVSSEPTIRELVRQNGHMDEDYGIRWITRYAHDKESESKIRMNDAQTLAIKTWLTPNEKRAAEGLQPLDGGDELASSFSVAVSGLEDEDEDVNEQTADEQDATHNKDGDNL